MDKLLYLSVA